MGGRDEDVWSSRLGRFLGRGSLENAGIFVLPMVGAVLKLVLIMAVGYAVLTLFKRYRTSGDVADED